MRHAPHALERAQRLPVLRAKVGGSPVLARRQRYGKRQAWRGSKPGSTAHSARMLRIIRPAPIRRTRAMPISAATNTLCVRCRAPLAPRASGLQRFLQVGPEQPQSGRQAEQDSRQHRDSQREEQDAAVEADLLGPRKRVRQGRQDRPRAPFARMVPRMPPASASRTLSVRSCRTIRPALGAEGGAHRELAAARRSPARAAGSRRWRTRSGARRRRRRGARGGSLRRFRRRPS